MTAERISAAFQAARAEGRAALMPYMMGGFPDRETSVAVAHAYVEGGADLIELGVPFSDPLADGPVIHAAATAALGAGATLDSVLEVCGEVSDRLPVVPMCYSNMVLAHGLSEFTRRLAHAGAAGVIVPDLPMEEAAEIAGELRSRELALIPLVAPTTPAERRKRICEHAEGFVYVVSDTRVTGERDELPAGLADLVEAVRKESDVPVAVGFGIGTPGQVATVGQVADGVIVGTRLVRAVSEAGAPEPAARATLDFLRTSREAMVAAGGR